MSNIPSGGIDSFVFTELQRHVVVYVHSAILYTGVMFSGECINLIYKISATVLPLYYIFDVDIVGRTQVLLIPLTMSLFYTSVTVRYVSELACATELFDMS